MRFRGGDVVAIDAYNGLVELMHAEHELLGIGIVLKENLLENHDNKVHRGEIVVMNDDAVTARDIELDVLTLLNL